MDGFAPWAARQCIPNARRIFKVNFDSMKSAPAHWLTAALLSFSIHAGSAQQREGILLDVSYCYGMPFADLKNRYGFHLAVGVGLRYQPPSFFGQSGIHVSYLFGNTVKEDVIAPFRSRFEGLIIGRDGIMTDVRLKQRGYYGQVFTGGLFPLPSAQLNHGIKYQVGLGFLEHKIRIQDDARAAAQFNDQFNKGLDRLTNGWAIVPFLGYEIQHRNRSLAFYFGIEPVLGFTSSKRSYNYDTNRSEYRIQRRDIFINFKAGWYIPFYFHDPEGIIY